MSERPMDHKRKVLKYIRQQIKPDQRYGKAVIYIDEKLKEIYKNETAPLQFPKELTFEGTAAVTLMKQIPKYLQNEINESITDGSTFTINKSILSNYKSQNKNTKSIPRKHETPYQPQTAIDKVCSACGWM